MSKRIEIRLNWGRLRQRYQCSSRQKKGELLDELCDLYGINRKYLIHKLNQPSHKPRKPRGPKPTYPGPVLRYVR